MDQREKERKLLEQADPSLVQTTSPAPVSDKKRQEMHLLMQADPSLKEGVIPSNLYDRPLPGATTPKREYPYGVGYEAVKNLPQDTWDLAKGFYHAAVNPRETAGSIIELAKGLPQAFVDRLLQTSGHDGLPPSAAMDRVNALADAKRAQYNSLDAVKATVADHPAGVLADASLLVPGLNPLNPAGLTGKAINATVGRTARGVGNYVEGVVNPTNLLAEKAVNGRPGVYNALNNPNGPTIVGTYDAAGNALNESIPTGPTSIAKPAKVAVTATRVQSLGKAAEDRLSDPSTDIKDAQNVARIDAIRHHFNVSGPDAIDNAEAAVKPISTANYTVAGNVLSDASTNAFYRLLNRPEVAKAMQEAETDAANEGRAFGQMVNGRYHLSGNELQAIKEKLDTVYDAKPTTQDEIKAVMASKKARNDFVDWAVQNNDSLRIARDTHRAMNQPISQMKLGQYLIDKMNDSAMQGATLDQKMSQFVNAIKDAPSEALTLKNAMGNSRIRSLEDIASPEQQQILSSIVDDYAREMRAEAEAAAANRPGSNFGAKLGTQMSDALHISPSNKWANFLIGKTNESLGNQTAGQLLTSAGTRDFVRNYLVRRAQIEHNSNMRGLAGNINAMLMNRAPFVTNALQQDSQNGGKK